MTCCTTALKRTEGYIKFKDVVIQSDVDIPIGSILPLFYIQGDVSIKQMTLFDYPSGAASNGVLTMGIYNSDEPFTPIIPDFFTDITATASLTLPMDVLKVASAVKPVGVATVPAGNTMYELVANVLGDSTSVLPTGLDRLSEENLYPNTYLIGAKSSTLIPAKTRMSLEVWYGSTV